MRYAEIHGEQVEAAPGGSGTCPSCCGPVRAKCGPLVRWHWAHVAGPDCDPWAEPMTDWHLSWQQLAPPDRREVRIPPHRADLVTTSGWVVELQHSTISVQEIREREEFYGRMLWIFDATDAWRDDRLIVRPRSDYVTFRWKHPRKTITACTAPVYLDLGRAHLIRVRKIYPGPPCGGWGVWVSRERVASVLAEHVGAA